MDVKDTTTRIHGPIHQKNGFTVFFIRDYADGIWWRYRISRKPVSSSIFVTCAWKPQEGIIIDCDMVDELVKALKSLQSERK